MSKTEIDPKVQGVISKLKFLSKIDKKEKLDVESLSLVADSFYNNLYRTVKSLAASQGFIWKTSESRNTSLSFIKTTAAEALELAKDLYNVSPDNTFQLSLGQMIVSTLEELKPGIDSLKKTYASDRMFASEIETFEDVLKAQILELKRMAPTSSASLSSSGTTKPLVATDATRSSGSRSDAHPDRNSSFDEDDGFTGDDDVRGED
jgi:hypothetical protein